MLDQPSIPHEDALLACPADRATVSPAWLPPLGRLDIYYPQGW